METDYKNKLFGITWAYEIFLDRTFMKKYTVKFDFLLTQSKNIKSGIV